MLTLAICGALLGALTMWRANRFVTRALGAVPALAGVVLLHAHAPLPPAADRKRLEDFCRHVGWDIGARYHGQLPALGERPDQGATPAGAFLVQLDALTPFLASAGALCVRDTTSCLRRVNEFPREASVLNARAMAPLIDDLEAAFYTGEPCAREGTSSAPTPPQPSPAASARAWWPLAGALLLGGRCC